MEKTIRVAERLTFNEWWDSLPASRISSKQLAQDAWNAALHQLPLDDDARRTRGGERCEALLHKAKDHTIQWLAEHPADDAEPITEEWLRSIGFKDSGTLTLRLKYECNGLPTELCCMLGDCLNRWSIGQNVGGRILCVEIAAQEARGQLRALLKGLGIPSGADAKGGE